MLKHTIAKILKISITRVSLLKKTIMSLLNAEPIFKPFNYPWAYDAWKKQQQIHWLPEEVPMADCIDLQS